MTPLEALKAIEQEAEKIVTEEALSLKANLVSASPVDTGIFKSSWVIVKKSGLSGLAWTIYNPLEYASILAGGVRFVNGRKYGSEQWRYGLDPMLEQTNLAISRRMKGVKK